MCGLHDPQPRILPTSRLLSVAEGLPWGSGADQEEPGVGGRRLVSPDSALLGKTLLPDSPQENGCKRQRVWVGDPQ